jgi:hypothetical protein
MICTTSTSVTVSKTHITSCLHCNHLLILAITAENKTKETIHASEHEEWKDVRVTEDVKVTEEVQVTAN